MSQDLFDEIACGGNLSQDFLGSSPGVSSGVSTAGVSSQPLLWTQEEYATDDTSSLNKCGQCEKVYKTVKGLETHVLLVHKLSQFSRVRCDRVFIGTLMGDLVEIILKEMQNDDCCENKIAVIGEILNSKENSDFVHFVESLSDIYGNTVGNRSKLLPANQFEQYLSSLNRVFHDQFDDLKLMFSIMIVSEIDEKLVSMLLFRLLHRLSEELYFHLLRDCREQVQGTSTESTAFVMDEKERESCKKHAVKLFQSYFKSASKLNSPVWRTRCICMCAKFVASDVKDSISRVDVLDFKQWNDGAIYLSKEAVDCFCCIELCVKRTFRTQSAVTAEKIMEKIMHVEYSDILNMWHSLTSDHLSDIDSMVFFKDFVSIITALSVRLEADKLEREEDEENMLEKVPLRANLRISLISPLDIHFDLSCLL